MATSEKRGRAKRSASNTRSGAGNQALSVKVPGFTYFSAGIECFISEVALEAMKTSSPATYRKIIRTAQRVVVF